MKFLENFQKNIEKDEKPHKTENEKLPFFIRISNRFSRKKTETFQIKENFTHKVKSFSFEISLYFISFDFMKRNFYLKLQY
jgi:hypothetical protein